MLVALLGPSACMVLYVVGSYLYLLWWNWRSSKYPAPRAETSRVNEQVEREVLLSSATQLARGLREGKYTSRQLVETFRRQVRGAVCLVSRLWLLESLSDATVTKGSEYRLDSSKLLFFSENRARAMTRNIAG